MADEVDRANDLFEDRRVVEIRSIARAMEKRNITGECDECGEQIEPARLAAYPAAMCCITCQEERDRYNRTHRPSKSAFKVETRSSES